MYITPKIVEAKILKDYYMYLRYDTGEEKVYNMEDLIQNCKFYKNLKDKEKFKKFKIVGDTIEWENGEDVAPEKLYQDSISLEEYKQQL